MKRNCRPHKRGILIELFDLNTAFMNLVAQRVSVLVSCCSCVNTMVSLKIASVLSINPDFEIMIWIILNAMQILFLENANHTKFIFCLDFWSIIDRRDQSGASACVADLDFVIEYFFLLSSVSKLEVLSSGACRQTR